MQIYRLIHNRVRYTNVEFNSCITFDVDNNDDDDDVHDEDDDYY